MATVLLQARTGSTRLPGKAMKEIMGMPMLFYTVETLKRARGVDRVVMLIPTNPADDVLENYAEKWGIHCFRGSEFNVLERFYLASLEYRDSYYFRATGDNPVLDYENPGRLLRALKEGDCDYAAERGMPLGSVVEAFTFGALEKCYNEAVEEDDIEHVTLFMKRSGRFRIQYIEAPEEYRSPKLRLTVDYSEDFERAAFIIENLYGKGIPSFKEVIDFARKNSWL
jgi:spore coat polysaccharide biosynthesis protein SpsF